MYRRNRVVESVFKARAACGLDGWTRALWGTSVGLPGTGQNGKTLRTQERSTLDRSPDTDRRENGFAGPISRSRSDQIVVDPEFPERI